jgi:mono/diheme cytochrome c family protein
MRGERYTRARRIALGVLGAALAAVAGAAAFVYFGVYDISATEQHTKPVYWLLQFTMQRSVAVRARQSETPDLSAPDTIDKGLRLYHLRCVQCHGAPGVAPDGAALGMTPVPGYLVPMAREWSAAEIQWVVKNGIKMTGMPAWKYRMSEDEIWQVTAFVKERLPYLTPDQYREMSAKAVGAGVAVAPRERASTGSASGDPEAGRRAIDQHSCAACHVIPGITGATQQVGPPLRGMASRTYIAGVLTNTPENMVQWLMWPQRERPGGAMPNLGVREKDARDIAAYLATLKAD